MKKHLPTIIVAVIFLCGLSLFLYPTVSNLYNQHLNNKLIGEYKEAFSSTTPEEFNEAMKDALEDTSWGFGFSHFIGAAFRYKVFQAGVEYNIATLKSVDWFDDSDNDANEYVENYINTMTDTKTKFNNFRIFLGFKF